MKKLVLAGLILIFIFSMTAPAYCDDALKKLGRGISNTFTFPLEIIEQIKRVNNSDGAFAAMTYGVVKGIAMMGVRAAVGVYELATFPIPFPKNYKPILTNPEFFFEEQNW